jgi:hypothetical protein
MSQAATRSNPIWALVPGGVSVLLTLEFWTHLLVPFLRTRVRFPFWPTGAIIELLASALLAALAAIRGARTWWIVVFYACASLCFLLFMFGG